MHDSLLNYSGSFNPNGIPLGTTRVSNLNISLNFPENIPRDPIKGRLRHDSLPMELLLFFLSVENLADLIGFYAHDVQEVGCKFLLNF